MADISQQLVDQVQAAIADKIPLRIEGSGTKSDFGRAFDDSETNILSTKEHSGVVDYKPVELIMTVRGGTSLAEIDKELAKNNQMLACDPRRFGGQATIAGSLAANQSGHARPWFGSLRDHVLGVKLINGQGEHLQFGGQVMKNVAGYDVSRLQAGSMGSFGVITEVSFKVLPKAEVSETMSLETTESEALKLMNKLAGTAKPLTGSGWVDGKLFLRVEGAKKAIDATMKQWKLNHGLEKITAKKADTFWQDYREHELDFFTSSDSKPIWRFSVNSNAEHVLADQSWAFNWCGSQRWLSGDFDLKEMSKQAAMMNGEVQLFSGGDRSGELALPANETMKKLMQNVKKSFDPDNIFNRGRLYSWL